MPSSPMYPIIRNRLYWASPKLRFLNPGLYIWTGKRNIRILPWPVWKRWRPEID